MADGPLHSRRRGAEALGHRRVQHLGHRVDDLHVVHRDDDGLPEVLIALDVGRDADLVDDGGDRVLQRVEPQLRGGRVLEDAPHPLHQGGGLAGLGQVVAHAQLFRVGQGLFPAESGNDDGLGHGSLPILQRLEQAQPVQARQGHVQQQQVRFPFLDQVQRLPAVPGGSRPGELTGLLNGLLQHRAEFLTGIRQKHSPSMIHVHSKPFLPDRLSERPDTLSSFSIKYHKFPCFSRWDYKKYEFFFDNILVSQCKPHI